MMPNSRALSYVPHGALPKGGAAPRAYDSGSAILALALTSNYSREGSWAISPPRRRGRGWGWQLCAKLTKSTVGALPSLTEKRVGHAYPSYLHALSIARPIPKN